MAMDFLNIFYEQNFSQQQFNKLVQDLGVSETELIDSAS